MKALFEKTFLPYVMLLFLIVVGTGIVSVQFVDHVLILISSLIVEFFIILMLISFMTAKMNKSLKKFSVTMTEMRQDNYGVRVYDDSTKMLSELSSKHNELARHLGEHSLKMRLKIEQLNTLINNTESSLILIDEKGYIQLVNRKFISNFGDTTINYQGELYYEVFKNDTIINTVKKAFLSEKIVTQSFKHYSGMDKYYYEIVGIPIFTSHNSLYGAVLVIRDVTELKKLESMRKDFVANVSHELKTPITSIKGFTETLLDGVLEHEETSREFLQIIYNEGNRMQLLIEDLLTLSRLENENFRLVLNTVNAKEVTKDIIPTFIHKAEAKNLTFTTTIEDDVIFKADKGRVKQIFINLLDNAINYTPEQGKVDLSVVKLDEYVRITVTDTGIGIKESALPRIFERFYRVDRDRSRYTGGTGLGLAIVKHIVEVHDGKIEIDSVVNQGTSVHVYLPL